MRRLTRAIVALAALAAMAGCGATQHAAARGANLTPVVHLGAQVGGVISAHANGSGSAAATTGGLAVSSLP